MGISQRAVPDVARSVSDGFDPEAARDVTTTVRECVAKIVGIVLEEVQLSTTLDDLGADSFHRIHIALALEERFGVTRPAFYESSQHLTVADYVQLVTAAGPADDSRSEHGAG